MSASLARLSLAALLAGALGTVRSVAMAADEIFVSDYSTNKV